MLRCSQIASFDRDLRVRENWGTLSVWSAEKPSAYAAPHHPCQVDERRNTLFESRPIIKFPPTLPGGWYGRALHRRSQCSHCEGRRFGDLYAGAVAPVHHPEHKEDDMEVQSSWAARACGYPDGPWAMSFGQDWPFGADDQPPHPRAMPSG